MDGYSRDPDPISNADRQPNPERNRQPGRDGFGVCLRQSDTVCDI
jgi:hypothetical protein